VAIRLVEPDLETLDALLAGEALAGLEIADDWERFPGALERTRDAVLANPASLRWGTRLFVVDETLIGWGGFKGAPRRHVVELGYAIAPAWEGRGLATAAVAALLREAFADPAVGAVIAHTEPRSGPSARVLEKSGFARDGEVPDVVLGSAWRFRIRREDWDAVHGG
jgi:[ribosomal protein S5]-alanine N-acetyltransferase